MDTQRTDDAVTRDLRRYQLAMRLVAHRARTRTIYTLTGYTRHRLGTLRRRWRVPSQARRRGPSPKSFAAFFRSPQAQNEGAVIASLCYLFGALPPRQSAGEKYVFPPRDEEQRLRTGERLCEVFEAFSSAFPGSDFELEQVVLLAAGLSQADTISLAQCKKCGCVILIDRQSVQKLICSQCHRWSANGVGVVPEHSPAAERVLISIDSTAQQSELF